MTYVGSCTLLQSKTHNGHRRIYVHVKNSNTTELSFLFPSRQLTFLKMEKIKIKNQCFIGQRTNSKLKALDHIFKKSDTLSSFIDWIFWISIKRSRVKLKTFSTRFHFKGNGKKVLVLIIKRAGIKI